MATAHRITWHTKEAEEFVRARGRDVVVAIARAVVARAKELLSVQGSPTDRSLPGEPPRKQTGDLQRSIGYTIDETTLKSQVGTPLPYGKYLELGTRRGLAARPWLRPAFAWVAARMDAIIARIR